MTNAQAWTPGPPDRRYLDDRAACAADVEFTTDDLLLVVVGAHLRSEIADRPLADRLVRLIRDWQRVTLDEEDPAMLPLVCTDLWFLNDRDLMRQPCIAIGEPGLNAATAYYASRLPRSYVVEDVCAVQFDPQFLESSVCLWGVDARATEAAFDAFVTRYLDEYLRAVHA
ncbi:MAG: hypothetical protein SGJ09_06355 [Phycisphaerae bacterium]|nr:hypothetical protein [Phycisphaerae bacterium]